MRDDHLLRTRLALTTRSTPPAQILRARWDGVQTARPQALRTRVAEPRFCCMCSAAILFAFGDHPEATAQAAAVYIPSRSAHVTFFKVENAYEKPGMS